MGEPSRILVVDDDAAMRMMLVEHLEAGGFRAEAASGVDAALLRLAEASFHGVVSDLQMPVRGGFDLLEELQNRIPGVPVILMSSFGWAETARQGIEKGARAFLAKPFDPAELIDLLRELLAMA